MADRIKPRYRLGIQWHLDNAKDDATKIPERTLFRLSGRYVPPALLVADIVHRSPAGFGEDDAASVCFHSVDTTRYGHMNARDLQPLI